MGEQRAAGDKGATGSGRYVSEPVTHPAAPVSRDSDVAGLKVVTLAPGRESETNIALDSGQRRDPYLGCTVDGRYKVEALLGEGGMGVVYRCTHKIIGKKVAMKVLRADMARDAEVTERFLNEAKSASTIGNPHIIDISDFGQFPDGSTYFVMEYLEGTSLTGVIETERPVQAARILHIAEQLGEGLSAAHQARIVHRDLKPDNIYLVQRGGEPDFVKILDFGIAKASTAEGKLTRAGAVFGTPHYMSPEQAAGSPVDHRGDVYSLGVILYELVCGHVPFDADNFMGILTQHIYKAPPPLREKSSLPAELAPGIEALIFKCMAKRPEDRYQTMDELLEDIRRVQRSEAPSSLSEVASRVEGFTIPEEYFGALAGEPSSKRPATTSSKRMLFVAAGLLVVAGTVLAYRGMGSAPEPVEEPPQPTAVEELPVPEPVVSEPTPEVVEPEVATTPVAVAVDPLDARVYNGEEDLGASPVVVQLKEGESVTLEIRRKGYVTEQLVVDGAVARHSVKLKPEAKARVARPPARPAAGKPRPAPTKAKPKIGGGEIINPWD